MVLKILILYIKNLNKHFFSNEIVPVNYTKENGIVAAYCNFEVLHQNNKLNINRTINFATKSKNEREKIKKILNEINLLKIRVGYVNLVTKIEPLYNNSEFNRILKDNRLSGDLKENKRTL